MAGSPAQSGVEWKVISTVRRCEHIEVVAKIMAVAMAVPPDVAIGL